MRRASSLVSPAWAEENLDRPDIVFIETGNEDTEYLKGHIPGAIWIGWEEFQDDLRACLRSWSAWLVDLGGVVGQGVVGGA